MRVAVIKYNAGNIGSVKNALDRIGVESTVTDDPVLINTADKVIFPGVGEASTTMAYLKSQKLDGLICSLKQPVLGICLGMQLMCSDSEEGTTEGLGIFSERVLRFQISEKIPHMGWNSVDFKPDGLFRNLTSGVYVYFVHSFYAELGSSAIAHCRYGLNFSASLQKDNFYGVQFHPEKSGPVGQQILNNFCDL